MQAYRVSELMNVRALRASRRSVLPRAADGRRAARRAHTQASSSSCLASCTAASTRAASGSLRGSSAAGRGDPRAARSPVLILNACVSSS